MKLTLFLSIIMSFSLFPIIGSAENRENKKHHKKPSSHQSLGSKGDRVIRKPIIYKENGSVLPKNRAVRHKENRLNKNKVIQHENSKSNINRNI